MKTKKIKLESLEVRSFITNLKETELNTVKGGWASFKGCMTKDVLPA